MSGSLEPSHSRLDLCMLRASAVKIARMRVRAKRSGGSVLARLRRLLMTEDTILPVYLPAIAFTLEVSLTFLRPMLGEHCFEASIVIQRKN